MKKIQKRAFFCTIIVFLFLVFLGFFLYRYLSNGKQWYVQNYNRELYTDDLQLMQGTIFDRNGIVLSSVSDGKRQFHEDELLRRATLHVVGDAYGKIGSSALNSLASELVTFDPFYGSSYAHTGNHCYLTIDSELCKLAYLAMGGKNGTVGVYNYKTGEILCLVSTPTYDTMNVPDDLETLPEYEGAYLNRFFSSTFRPGSVMKTVTLQAALETLPEVREQIFTCNGEMVIDGTLVSCPKAHGRMNLKTAFALSCNCTFAWLATKIGGEALLNYTKQAGLTNSYRIGKVSTARGTFEMATVDDYQLAYAAIGLYHDLVNPCSLMIYYGAIANGGSAAIPTYVKEFRDADNALLSTPQTRYSELLCSETTAETLREYLINNVTIVYGTDRFPNLPLGAKSGTIEKKTGASDCWFAGFLTSEQYPYAFVVYLQNAGSGNRVAGSVAGTVLKYLVGEQSE